MGNFDLKNAVGAFTDRLSQAEFMQTTYPILFDDARIYWAWSWDDMSYHRVDETDILIAIKNATSDRSVIADKSKRMIMESIRVTGRERDVSDLPPNYIQFKNGVVDVITGERFQASPDYMFTSPVPHDIGESVECPYIDKLFGEWVGEDGKITLYELMAYCLYQGYPINRIFALYGTGRNGKSQYIKIINNLIGSDNTCSTSLDLIIASRFETAKLYKKRAAFVSETDFAVMRKTAMLKKLSGDDMVGGEFKGKDGFDFWNHAKIIIATNNLPETDDKTDGFYARWIVVDFPNQFDGGVSVVDSIPEGEYENLCCKLIKILKDLLVRGKFSREGTIKDRMMKYEEKSNPIKHFIGECCVRDLNCEIQFHVFYKELEGWMDGRRYRELPVKAVTKWLRDSGYESEWKRWGGDKKYLTFHGIRFRNEADDLEDSGSLGSLGSVVPLTPHVCEGGIEHGYQDYQDYQPSQQQSKPTDLTSDSESKLKHALGELARKPRGSDGWSVEEITETFPQITTQSYINDLLESHGLALGFKRAPRGWKL